MGVQVRFRHSGWSCQQIASLSHPKAPPNSHRKLGSAPECPGGAGAAAAVMVSVSPCPKPLYTRWRHAWTLIAPPLALCGRLMAPAQPHAAAGCAHMSWKQPHPVARPCDLPPPPPPPAAHGTQHSRSRSRCTPAWATSRWSCFARTRRAPPRTSWPWPPRATMTAQFSTATSRHSWCRWVLLLGAAAGWVEISRARRSHGWRQEPWKQHRRVRHSPAAPPEAAAAAAAWRRRAAIPRARARVASRSTTQRMASSLMRSRST